VSFFFDLAGEEHELELAALELWALAGAEGAARIGIGPDGADIARSAYVSLCARELAVADSPDKLLDKIAGLHLEADRFRIEVVRRPARGSTRTDLIVAVADILPGNPDLDRPLVRYVIHSCGNVWRFGEVVSRSSRSYLQYEHMPHNLSHALPVRFARALVNIAAAPGDTLIDPCCGSGTCIISALAVGIEASGGDILEGSVDITAKNLAHFGMQPRLWVGDARRLGRIDDPTPCADASGNYDAAIVDFPYGLTSHPDPHLQREVLAALRTATERVVIVTGAPAEEDLAASGFMPVRCAKVPKNALVRHVYLALAA
jgi:hypothetical protein